MIRFISFLLGLLVAVGFALAGEPITLNRDAYQNSCAVSVAQQESRIDFQWRIGDDQTARVEFDLRANKPLLNSISVRGPESTSFREIAGSLDPVLHVRVGDRDLKKRNGWTIFFDRMQEKPSTLHEAQFKWQAARLSSNEDRATLSIQGVTAGPFSGELRYTFFSGSPFILQEAVLTTHRGHTAFLYDAGITFHGSLPNRVVWKSEDEFHSATAESVSQSRNLNVQGRTVAAEFAAGSIAVFPPPHRYFYPLDFSDNLANIWVGPDYGGPSQPFGIGIRHDPQGDRRYVPWFNAPPESRQEMGLFFHVSGNDAETTWQQVAQLTHEDRFPPLPGHQVFASHFHVEHTAELLKEQTQLDGDAPQATRMLGRLPSGGQYAIPQRLISPGFVETLRKQGVEIVHLAEFHFGATPRLATDERLRNLELLHAECARLSGDGFLLLPGEEPNVHLGGHWISFFPEPVFWVLSRPEGTPFESDDPRLGKVYHVGSEADVHRLLRSRQGLAWTAHPRIKSSTGFPDRYRDRLFFQSDRFLGGAWKAMPADLSHPQLGRRVLDLLDDMSNWGDPKYVLGEVDVFKIEPHHELYAHMNVNYLRLDEVPRFDDGWHSVLDALRAGQFFVTTGEVLIHEFKVNGQESGEIASPSDSSMDRIELTLEWTFPLKFAEIVSGNGETSNRKRVDLSRTAAFGREAMSISVDLAGQKWVRVEVWDVATNGAFTQPVWIGSE